MIKRKSSKQSSTLELLDYTFFTDRDLGHSFPTILDESGFNVKIHDEHFPQDMEDVGWFREIGRRDWIVLSRNHKQRRNPVELNTWMECKIRGFYIVGTAPFNELANNVVNTRHKIVKFLNKNLDPFMGKIYRPPTSKMNKVGDIKMWVSHEQWTAEQVRKGLKD